MGVDHDFAAVQLLKDRRKFVVAQPFIAIAGHHADAVHFQRVEGVSDFL